MNSRGEVLTAVLLGLAVAVLPCTAPVFAATLYVSPTGGAVAPYTNWTDAATNILSALDASADGDTVLVTNGNYNVGSCLVSNLPCRVAITNAVTVQSINGPLATRIEGNPDYPDSIRCAYVGPNARLVGFTLCSGGTLLFDPAAVNTSGGGVMCEGGTVSGCLISSNWAVNGGGVMCYNGGTIRNSLVVSNSCMSLGGGVILSGGGFIENCTVSMNNSSANGGGIYFKDAGSVVNSIVYGNSAAATGDNWDTSGTNMTVEFTCTTPAADGSNNIAADPQFINPPAGNFHLSPGSPCIDTGTNSSWMAGATDFDGKSRIMNSLVDMGCFEYPFTVDTYTLTVATPYGMALPAGVTTNNYGTNLSCSVLDSPVTVGTTQYACLGWIGSGSVPVSGVGTNVSMMITNTSAITWLWKTNYWLHSAASPHGSVDVSDQWLAGDSTIVITATPAVGSYFSGWTGDVPPANTNDNPLTLTMDQARSIAASFAMTTHYVSPTGSNVAPFMSWGDAATNIQEAVDSAHEGELVLVTNGVYDAGSRATPGHSLSNRVAITNNILVRSVNGPTVTIIAGNGPLGDCAVRCVFIANGMLDGFTLTNGCTQTNGDTLYDCSGGGAYAQGGQLNNCALYGNSASGSGGAVFNGMLNNCTLIGNSAGSEGGGAYGSVLDNCTLAGNLAGTDGGGACLGTLNNCIVYYNLSATSNNISGGTANYCCTTPDPGGTGNITGEPMFMDTNAANYRLHAGSPCINAGNNAGVHGALDLDGNPRIVFGTVDMGAYEFCQLMLLSINSDHGSCTPPAGSYTNDYDAQPTNAVTFEDLNGTTQYLCRGWTMTGNEPVSGATNSFVMTQTNNAALTWLWRTNFWLAATGEGGTVDVATGWYESGSSQVMTATASNGYHWVNWTGDTNGCEPNGSQITIPMDGPRSIGASFAINMYDITASSGSNGIIEPIGTVWVAHGGSTNFTFTADVNYHVRNVVVDGVPVGPVNSYTFANVTNGGHTITADFAANYTGDWPCYRGPNRDGRTLEHITRWPPKELWRANIGQGYSQVVVSDGRVYVTGWTNEVTNTQDVVYCFSESSTGTNPAPLWQKSYQCGYGIDSRWKGTRATPTVDGNEIYTFSLEGRLVCFDKVTGTTNWEVSVTNGSSTWGLSGSPLVEGSNVIVNAGSSGVAIDKSGTRTNWFSTGKTAYSSPNAVTIGNQRTVVIVGGNSVSGVDPANGTVLWYFAMGPETMIDPIVSGNRIWACKADNISAQGSFVMELGSGHLTNTVWRNNSVGNGDNAPVLCNGYLYYIYCVGGVSGLLCMDYATGNKMWATTNSGGGDTFWYMSGISMANDELVIADDKKGKVELIVATATPSGYRETHRATNLVSGTMWTSPTLANGKLYIRTHEGTVVCYDVTAREPSINNGSGASNLTASSAFLGGELTSTGGASTAVSIYWGPTDGGTDVQAWSNVVNVDVLDVGPFSTNITGLASETEYYYRCFASNALDVAWATDTTNFITPSIPEIDNAGGPTDITPGSATLNGNLTSTGGAPTTALIYWGPTDGNTNAASWTNIIDMGVLPMGLFSSGLTGLAPDTTYYYRCRASNAAGIAWSQSSTNFITRTLPDINNAGGVSGLTASSAILNGDLASTGGAPTTVVIYWGPADGGMDPASWSNSIDMGVLPAGLYASGIGGLTSNTCYYYRCWASNAAGIIWAPSSTNFTTPPLPGVDNAVGASGITRSSANLNGSLITTGAAPTTVVIYWGPTDGDTNTAAWSNSVDMGVLPSGPFSSQVCGLTLNASYYYSCRASNTAGIVWSPSSASFTASDSAPAFSNWLYRMKIAFPGYSRPETLADFPALVTLGTNCPNFFYTQFASTNGFDLRFVASDNTTELNYEIERWSTTDDSYVWVRLPSLSGTNTFVWAYWGNSNAVTQQAYTTDGSTWANGFAGVYHMNEGGTGIRFDSSSNVNNGAVAGYEGDENTFGVIAFADHMNASGADDTNDAVVVPDSSSLDVSTQLTVSVWLNSDDWTAESMFVGKEGSFTFYNRVDQSLSNFTLRLPGIVPADQVTYPVSNLATGQWYQLVGTYDSSGTDSNFVLYVDGTQVSATTASGDIAVGPAPLYIGLAADGSSPFKGILDEIEISSVARSSNWIWAGFMNQRSNSVFNTCGSVVGNSDAHCTITVEPSPYGSITPSGEVAVVFGSSQAFSITAATNFDISDILVDGSSVGATNAYTFFDVTTDHTIGAVFVPQPRSLVVNSEHGVPIPPAGTNVLLAYGTATCFAAGSPVMEGTTQWVCTGWAGTGNIPASGNGTNTDPIVITDDSSITWNWKTQYWLAVAGSNGDVNGGGWYDCGSNATVTATASNEYHFVDWNGDVPPACTYDNPLVLTMDQPRIIAANFAAGTGTYYTITATADANGTIWPAGFVSVLENANRGFRITPTSGYNIGNLIVDGSSVGATNWYEFINVTNDHTISPTFAPILAAKGTPIVWLDSHGLTGDHDAQEIADPDNDGCPTWQEYIAGTDPTNRASCFSVSGLYGTGNMQSVLYWDGKTGRLYSVYSKTNIMDIQWNTNLDSQPASAGVMSYTNNADDAIRKYFRIGVRLQ